MLLHLSSATDSTHILLSLQILHVIINILRGKHGEKLFSSYRSMLIFLYVVVLFFQVLI